MEAEARPRVAMGIMILKEGKVLLSVRKNEPGAGGYQFTGGHLENMESLEDCAKRETMEEAGIEIDNVRFLYLANVRKFAPKHYVHIGMIADWKSGEPRQLEPEKNGPWDWYDTENLPQPLLLFAELHFRALKEGITYFGDIR